MVVATSHWWSRRYRQLPVWAWFAIGLFTVAVLGSIGEEITSDPDVHVVATETVPPDAPSEPASTIGAPPLTTAPPTTATPTTAAVRPTAATPTTIATPTLAPSVAPTTLATPTTRPSVDPQALAEVRDILAGIKIAEPEPGRATYRREDYVGDGWLDADGDCLNTRQELLAQWSTVVPVIEDCRVVSGGWESPYDGYETSDPDAITVDHLVPLAEAHRSGAWRWDNATKRQFANDLTPGHLNLVSDETNQNKADNTPDRWLPDELVSHCQYATDWIITKHRYQLTVSASERDALDEALNTCEQPGAELAELPASQPVDVSTTIATTTTTTTVAPSDGPGLIEVLSCDARAETVTIANTGGEPVDLGGYMLHDEESRHSTSLSGVLDAGEQVIYVSGDQPDPEGSIRWTGQNVWNNDGDTATIRRPDGTVSERACRT